VRAQVLTDAGQASFNFTQEKLPNVISKPAAAASYVFTKAIPKTLDTAGKYIVSKPIGLVYNSVKTVAIKTAQAGEAVGRGVAKGANALGNSLDKITKLSEVFEREVYEREIEFQNQLLAQLANKKLSKDREFRERIAQNIIAGDQPYFTLAKAKLPLKTDLAFSQPAVILPGVSFEASIKPSKSVNNIKTLIYLEQEYSFWQKIFSRLRLIQPIEAKTKTVKFINEAQAKSYLVAEYNYADPDNDGIYVAKITAPSLKGLYQLKTLIEYQDLSVKEVSEKIQIEGLGYIYTKTKRGNEERLTNAIVGAYELQTNNELVLWDGKKFDQRNPIITDKTAEYYFILPAGTYKIKVQAPGFKNYESEPIKLASPAIINQAIEMAEE
jgi:hypothetical protein